MSPKVRRAVIGFAVAFILGLVFGLLHAGFWGSFLAALLGVITFFVMGMQEGNRSVAAVPDAERAQALATPPPAGSGLVYVYREGFAGSQLGFDVEVDGATVTQLKSPRFARLLLAAGEHRLNVGPKAGFGAAQNASSSISISVAAGQTLVYQVRVERGMAKNTIVLAPVQDVAGALSKFAGMPMASLEQNRSV